MYSPVQLRFTHPEESDGDSDASDASVPPVRTTLFLGAIANERVALELDFGPELETESGLVLEAELADAEGAEVGPVPGPEASLEPGPDDGLEPGPVGAELMLKQAADPLPESGPALKAVPVLADTEEAEHSPEAGLEPGPAPEPEQEAALNDAPDWNALVADYKPTTKRSRSDLEDML